MEFKTEDLEAITTLSQALWPDPERSSRVASETLAAVSTITLEPELVIERTSIALVQRAGRDGVPPAAKIQNSFYRLTTEERAVLSALHRSKWSYARVGKLLGRTSDEIAELAWGARMELVAGSLGGTQIPYPIGSGPALVDCPEYNPRKPWTQTFLDSELLATDRIFLQSHLMNCRSCRQVLQNARKLYYAAESRVPEPREMVLQMDVLARSGKRASQARNPTEVGFIEGLLGFLARKEVMNFLIAAVTILVFYRKFHH